MSVRFLKIINPSSEFGMCFSLSCADGIQTMYAAQGFRRYLPCFTSRSQLHGEKTMINIGRISDAAPLGLSHLPSKD